MYIPYVLPMGVINHAHIRLERLLLSNRAYLTTCIQLTLVSCLNIHNITNLELLFDLRQFLHLLAQLEGGHDGVGAGQRHVRGTGEGAIRVQSRPRALQRVVVLLRDAVGALARDRVRPVDGVSARQEQLDQLVVVVVRRQDQRGDVWRELTLFVGAEERVSLAPACPLLVRAAGDVARVLDDRAHDLRVALADGVAQRLLDAVEAEFFEEELDGLDGLAVDGQM